MVRASSAHEADDKYVHFDKKIQKEDAVWITYS
jgi:hypothetical protein